MSSPAFTEVDRCRSCDGSDLAPVLDLGLQPLANAYPAVDDPAEEPRYPLAVVRCRGCSLVQLTGTVDPGLLFDDYPYFSSYSDTAVASARQVANTLTDDLRLDSNDLAVEIASNDGYLLQHYIERGVPVLGVEPAGNIAPVAVERGIPTMNEYFTTSLGRHLAAEGKQASVLHANNVLAHVPNINDFVGGIAALLRPDGAAVVESPYLARLIDDRQFDTIYHEHVFYYSLTAVKALVERHGLVVADVEQIPIHGGTVRYTLRHAGTEPTPAVADLLADEQRRGLNEDFYYEDFSDRVAELRRDLTTLLGDLKQSGASVAAYGAAAKGTVLLNHFGVDHSTIDFVVDRNVHKQQRRMPGVGIPIVDPSALLTHRPDYTLLLVWNFAEEVLEQQREYREAGGRFVLPGPTVVVR